MKRSLFVLFVVLFIFFVGGMVSQVEAVAVCPTLPTNTGTITATITLPNSGTHRIWSRLQAASTTSNSYWLQIDSQCGIQIGGTAVSTTAWTWVDTSLSLTAGAHSVKMIGNTPDVKLDRLLFLTDVSCVPTGMGENCNQVATATVTPSPTPQVGQPTKFAITLFLHGLGNGGDGTNPDSTGNFSPRRLQRTVSVEVLNSQNQLLLTKQGTVLFETASGSFKGVIDMGTTLPTGVYSVKVRTDQFLKAKAPGIQSVTNGTTYQVPPITFITGDITNDNAVNILDYTIIVDCYSDLLPAVNCNPTKKQTADISDEGDVNQIDYNLFLRELSNRSGE